MTKIILIVFFSFITVRSLAQQATIDSLLNVLSHHPQPDTARLVVLNEIAYSYSKIDPDKGITLADEAITLALQTKQLSKLATAYAYKALNLSAKGEDSLALQLHQAAYQIHVERKDNVKMGSALHNIGLIYFNWSKYEQALAYHQQALDIFERVGNQLRMATALNSIGVNYMSLSDYPRALEYYLKVLSISEALGEQQVIASALTNVGIVYKNLSKYPDALAYHQKALNLYQQSGNKKGMASVLGNMGVVYDLQLNPNKALECYQQALDISKSIGNKQGMASNITNMGIIYLDEADYAKAWDYFHKAADTYRQMASGNNTAIAFNYIGQLIRKAPDNFLIKNGIPPQLRYVKAAEYHKQSLQLTIASGSLFTQAVAWEDLQETYEAQKDFQGALQAYKQFISLRDSMFNEEKTEEITRKQMQFDFEKKETILKVAHEKAQLIAAEEIKRQRLIRNATLGGGVLFLLAAGISFIFYRRKRNADEQAQEAEFKALVSDTEMKALRAQMNPHFIFNSLNSISDFMARHDVKMADHYLSKFAKVMRLILENSEQKEVSLCDDLQALELYMQLERMRLNNKFTYQILIDEAIDTETTLIPPLILQPFVENSIWHGIARMQGEGKILIHIHKEGDMINCIVEDNGVGRGKQEVLMQAQANGNKKLGMKITSARIEILNTLKKSNAAIHISDLEKGTKVEVKLPLALAF